MSFFYTVSKWLRYSLPENVGASNVVQKNGSTFLFPYPCNSISKCGPYSLEIDSGRYLFELWGAAGGTDCFTDLPVQSRTSLGAYVSGIIDIYKKQNFLLYVGGRGHNGILTGYTLGGYNGGGNGGFSASSGGGATDLRLNEKLESRIIVAGAGGGAERTGLGHGGGLEGVNGPCLDYSYGFCNYLEGKSTGGTQTNGGIGGGLSANGTNGGFGYGGDGTCPTTDGGPGGGAGYYGGGAMCDCCSGSGGSSFISGHEGCNAITSENDLTPSNSSIHYSGLYFIKTKMLSGNEQIPLQDLNPFHPKLGSFISNGAFRITRISDVPTQPFKSKKYLERAYLN